MITLTNDQLLKIDLLDTLFGSLSVEQLKELTEQECVASKLRGNMANPGILKGLIRTSEFQAVELMNLRSDTLVLKNDFQDLVRILNKELFSPTYNQEFNNLKQKHNIY
jgi:hypothetical protein